MTGNTKERGSKLRRYEQTLSRELRVLMAEKNLSQKTVAHALEKAGIQESARGLSAKLNAGTFSAAYYLAIKEVLETL